MKAKHLLRWVLVTHFSQHLPQSHVRKIPISVSVCRICLPAPFIEAQFRSRMDHHALDDEIQLIFKPSVWLKKKNSNLSTYLNSIVQSFQWFIFFLREPSGIVHKDIFHQLLPRPLPIHVVLIECLLGARSQILGTGRVTTTGPVPGFMKLTIMWGGRR